MPLLLPPPLLLQTNSHGSCWSPRPSIEAPVEMCCEQHACCHVDMWYLEPHYALN